MCKKKRNEQEEKAKYDDFNINKRQATNMVVKSILIIVVSMLVTYITLFVLFNFLYPAVSSGNGSGNSHALSSSTTYYKNGSSFYILSSSQKHYKCTNSSHESSTNDYTSSSVSGTCYSTTTSYTTQTYPHSCSPSSYGSHSIVFVKGEHSFEINSYYKHYASEKSGSLLNYKWVCVRCGAETGAGTLDSGSHEWGQCSRVETYKCVYCNSVWTDIDLSSPYNTTCSSHVVYKCEYCAKTSDSSFSGTCSSNITGYKCSYCNGTFSSNSTATCSSRTYRKCSECSGNWNSCSCRNYYSHSISYNYTQYTYTNIDTGSTTTSTSSYSTATGFTISYNANGGSGAMSSQYFLHGHSQNLTANAFTRSNYRFKGWATSASGAVTYTDKQSVSLSSGSNITLYANWELLSFTVTLNNQGATTAGSASVTATNGQPMPSITVPQKTGYTFGGYYTGTNGSGTQYYTASGASARTCDLTEATTLYAKWTANTYTVILDNQGATTAGSASVTATYGSAMPSITKPTKTGYTFGGYYTGTNGSGTQYYSASGASIKNYDKASSLTLYAKWTANTYTVTYNANGGNVSPTTKTVTYDATYGALATPTRTGYTFANWYLCNTLDKNINNWDSVTRIDMLSNSIWKMTTAGDLGRYFHLVVTYKGTIGVVQFNDYGLTSDMYSVSTDANGVNRMVIDYLLIEEHISKRGNYDYEKNYRFVDFEGVQNLTELAVVECWIGDVITADTVVKTDSNHSLSAFWTANKYNVAMDESGFAGMMSPLVGGFENTGWAGGSYDTTHVRSGKYSYKITATTASREFYAYTSDSYTINASNKTHIFYIQFWGYQETLIPNSYCQVYWPVEEPSFGPTVANKLKSANQWNMYSFYGDRSKNPINASTKFRIDFDNLGVAGTLWLDDFMIYDLTEIFGAGNEPSKEWCDLMIMTGVTVQELTYDREQNLTAHRSQMVKTGQTFAGWTSTPRTTLSANIAEYDDQAGVKNLASNRGALVTLYAVWTPRAQNVTVSANMADAVGILDGAGDYHYGDKVVLRAYAKGNHIFVHWLKNGNVFTGNTDQDLTFYVVSDDEYTAVFRRASVKTDDIYLQISCEDTDVESGYGYANYMLTIKNGASVVSFSAVPADGFKFVGWSISGTMSTKYTTQRIDIPLIDAQGRVICAVFAKV